MDVFIDEKSLKYVFTQRELNLCQLRLLQLLMDYDMNVHYHLASSSMRMGCTTDVEDEKK